MITTSSPSNINVIELEQRLQKTLKKRQDLQSQLVNYQQEYNNLAANLEKKQTGFFNKLFTKKESIESLGLELDEKRKYLDQLHQDLAAAYVHMDIYPDETKKEIYKSLVERFTQLSASRKIWNIVTINQNSELKSSAKQTVDRKEVCISLRSIECIQSEFPGLCFEDNKGNDFYIYPAGIVHYNGNGTIQADEFSSIKFTFSPQLFIEPKESVPADAKIVDHAWQKVNKDGTPDMRFKGNRQMPVVKYGQLQFVFLSRPEEIFYISNYGAADEFATTFKEYIGHTIVQSNGSPSTNERSGYSPVETTESEDFPREYYYLLKEYFGQLQELSHKIGEDEDIKQRLHVESHEISFSKFMQYCIAYDLGQLTKILGKGNINKHSLEAAGTALMVSRLLSHNDMLVKFDYDEINQAYTEQRMQGIIEAMISIAGNSNPLKINITDTDSNKDIPVNNSLSLPALLKNMDHDLFDEYVTTLYRFASIIAKADAVVSKEEEKILNQIYKQLNHPLPERKAQAKIYAGNNDSIDDILKELNSLIGLEDVKKEINTLVNFIKVQKAREAAGLKATNISYHIVFTGNPGTGKTTVARIIGNIYKALGILKTGQIVETDRSGLIAEYVGQTAVKVNKVVDSALDGVLFIDEAYALVSDGMNDYGKEAIATLIKRMEDDRDKLVLIIAGYNKEMQDLIETNPGFKSRFNRYIDFKDYSADELLQIYIAQSSKLEYRISYEAQEKLKELFYKAYSQKDKSFGNGRFVRNIFEKTLEKQANRIASLGSLNKEVLVTIEAEDIPI
jgi:AAA+ superfamily predicted ATPase